MKFIQISDVHIRNLKYHTEYRKVFENLYRKIDELKPDAVINTGDTAHTKTQISPEFVEMTSEHIREVSKRVPYHLILGNHDLNLMNPDRQDAITPIVESIRSQKVFLHKNSGLYQFAPGFNFWVFSLADHENYPLPSHWAKYPNDINIGLFHGSVSTCVTDSNWRMTHVEHDLSIFDGLDYALLGDIHKQQSFQGGKIWYAGSLIQQNFGEEIDKGFLFWEINSKTDFKVTPYNLEGSRKFYTVRLNEDLSLPDVTYEEGSRLRISPPRSLTLSEHKTILKNVKKLYKPHDVVMLGAASVAAHKTSVSKQNVDFENLRQITVQEKLIRDYLQTKIKGLADKIVDKIIELNRKYQIHVDQNDDSARNVSWEINKIAWSNLFNFGENNILDFSQLGGLTGIFAPNASGKSNIIDIILETCFDSTTKGVGKNIFLINDNKELASAVADITANSQDYVIERSIERIKYGQRKFAEAKEWGKTNVNFSIVDSDGALEPLIGVSRPETERNIRQRLGSFEDFMLTSLSAQWNQLDIISCKETKRKEILYRFLDLDIFEDKCILAKEESKEHLNKLRDLEDNGIEEAAKKLQTSVEHLKRLIQNSQQKTEELTDQIQGLDEQILQISSGKVKVNQFELGNWAGKIKTAEMKLLEERKKLSELYQPLDEVELSLQKLAKLESKFDLPLYEEKSARLSQVEIDLTGARASLKNRQNDLREHEKNSALLNEVPCGDKFPSCKFLINAFDSRSQIEKCKKVVQECQEKIELLEKERVDLLPFRERLESYRKFMGEQQSFISRRDNLKLQIENKKLKIESLESEKVKALEEKTKYEQMESDIRKNHELDSQISALQDQKRDLQRGLNEIKTNEMELSRKIGMEQGVLEKITSQLTQLQELRDTCSAFEYFIQMMGKDGLPYQIMTEKLPIINEEINKILSNAADFNVYIEHDPEEQSLPIYIQYSEYKSRLLELGSGAEKMLASVAIRAALMSISSLPKSNLFIIDEGFGKLDPKNLESIQRMFDYLKSVFDHVLIISHIDTMKDMVDNIIEITNDEEGYAHVEIGS